MRREISTRPSLWRSVRAVAWSFLGLRGASGLDEDSRLNPLVVLAVGLAAGLLFVLALMLLVHWIV